MLTKSENLPQARDFNFDRCTRLMCDVEDSLTYELLHIVDPLC